MLEEIRTREETILKGRSESVQTKRSLSDVLEKWMGFGKLGPHSLSGSVPSDDGMSTLQKITVEIGKEVYPSLLER